MYDITKPLLYCVASCLGYPSKQERACPGITWGVLLLPKRVGPSQKAEWNTSASTNENQRKFSQSLESNLNPQDVCVQTPYWVK